MLEIAVPQGAHEIISALRSGGYEAYLVGGCVRDILLGAAPKDWDICTNAAPDKVKSCLSGYKIDVLELIKYHDAEIPNTQKTVKRWLNRIDCLRSSWPISMHIPRRTESSVSLRSPIFCRHWSKYSRTSSASHSRI